MINQQRINELLDLAFKNGYNFTFVDVEKVMGCLYDSNQDVKDYLNEYPYWHEHNATVRGFVREWQCNNKQNIFVNK